MKRIVSIIALFVVLIGCFTTNSFATDEVNENTYLETEKTERTTGLISSYKITLKKDGTTLNITGKTQCSTDVVKCGIRNIVVEYRTSSSADWQTYQECDDYYVETYSCNYNMSITNVPSSYQYRVTCQHYAKENIFSTQKIDNVSEIV